MIPLRRTALCLSLLLPVCASAQLGPTGNATPDANKMLTVRVRTFDDRPLVDKVKVSLTSANSMNMSQENFTDGAGEVRFYGLNAGQYRVTMKGNGIKDATSDLFTIQRGESVHSEIVYVEPVATENSAAPGGSISALELNVPKKAQKEFDKGAELMEKDAASAKEHFERALELYPTYPSAYNNLGVLAMRTNDSESARRDFEKAISLDPHSSRALLNMARLSQQAKDMKAVEKYAQEAASADPSNAEALLLLANAQLTNHEPDAAVNTVKHLHQLPAHEKFGIAHFIAGRAEEMLDQQADALVEYKLFLREAPQSASAPAAQEAIARLQKGTER